MDTGEVGNISGQRSKAERADTTEFTSQSDSVDAVSCYEFCWCWEYCILRSGFHTLWNQMQQIKWQLHYLFFLHDRCVHLPSNFRALAFFLCDIHSCPIYLRAPAAKSSFYIFNNIFLTLWGRLLILYQHFPPQITLQIKTSLNVLGLFKFIAALSNTLHVWHMICVNGHKPCTLILLTCLIK